MFTEAFAYKTWADSRTLQAVATIDRSAHPRSFAFALQQLNHMVIVEELFKSRLCDLPAPHGSTNTDLVPSFDELARRLSDSAQWFRRYLASLENPEKQLAFVFADGRRGMMSVKEILFHIVNHSSYHRGCIAHALDLASVAHPADGYGIYIHEHEPERRQA